MSFVVACLSFRTIRVLMQKAKWLHKITPKTAAIDSSVHESDSREVNMVCGQEYICKNHIFWWF